MPTRMPRTSQNGMPMAHSPIVARNPTAAETISRDFTKPVSCRLTSVRKSVTRSRWVRGTMAIEPRPISGSDSRIT